MKENNSNTDDIINKLIELIDDEFFCVDERYPSSLLLEKMTQHEKAKIIIESGLTYYVYAERTIIYNLLKNDAHPGITIHNWIALHAHELPKPIIIYDSDLHPDIRKLLYKHSYEIERAKIGKVHGSFNITDLDLSYLESMPDQDPSYYIISEFQEEVEPEASFPLDVYLSKEKGLKSSPELHLEAGWQIDILVTVKLNLEIRGASFQSILVNPENLNKKLRFAFKAGNLGKGAFIVTACHKGSVLFSTEYEVNIVPETTKKTSSPKQVSFAGKPQNTPADLTLLIFQKPQPGGVMLEYKLFSPNPELKLYYTSFNTTITQPDVAAFFLDFFNDVDAIQQITKEDRLNAMEMMQAKGAYLFKNLFPPECRRILWENRDQIQSIIINSEEPWIPWEMSFMYSDTTGIDDGFFLCEKYEMSRWLMGQCSPSTEIDLSSIAFVIPSDSNLVAPPSEQKQIEDILNGIHATSESIPATFSEVKKSFSSGKYSVWHFSGHGTDSQGTNTSRYKIILENKQTLSPIDITGLKKIGAKKPIIFFNACEASRPGLGLTGLSGWPKEFIDNHVSAFIGAYWSVVDETACKFAVKFYELLAKGETIAAAFKEARIHIKNEGNPTWLAYSLYADPFAKLSTPITS